MNKESVTRKTLDKNQFRELRLTSEKISKFLDKRLKLHLSILKPLFFPKKLLGAYIQSSITEDVLGADKAFLELKEKYLSICGEPFDLPKKLQIPLPPISDQLEGTPFQYPIYLNDQEEPIYVTSPAQWVLSYQCESSLNRLRDMVVKGSVTRHPDNMKQTIINHLAMVIFLEYFPALTQLLEDLRYEVEIRELKEFGGLSVAILKSPIETFLPPDDFILDYTMITGVPKFHEIVNPEAIETIYDPLQISLKKFR